MFKGSYPALVTPFKDGAVDFDALKKLVDWHVAEGSHGLVPVGTTGESPTVTPEEHKRLVEICVAEAKGRVPVIVGTGFARDRRSAVGRPLLACRRRVGPWAS